MNKLKVLLLFLLLSTVTSFGQVKETVYSNPKDSLSNYYIVFHPSTQSKGLLLLLPSFGESPEIASKETDIYDFAAKEGLTTVFVSLQLGTNSFYIDSLSQDSLDALIQRLVLKYSHKDQKFYLGGFSLGGAGVVKYAERAYCSKDMKRPNAIFAIDPPLDFERMYKSSQYAVINSKSEVAKQEADYFIKRLDYEFDGSPLENLKAYHIISPFSYSDTTNSNINKIISCPIMLICEPDINWQIDNRSRNLYDLNVLDCSSVINYLKIQGNLNAQLIITSDKGYRKYSGKRNPHSWSIANSNETIKWLLKF
jgi:hypothetical protein